MCHPALCQDDTGDHCLYTVAFLYINGIGWGLAVWPHCTSRLSSDTYYHQDCIRKLSSLEPLCHEGRLVRSLQRHLDRACPGFDWLRSMPHRVVPRWGVALWGACCSFPRCVQIPHRATSSFLVIREKKIRLDICHSEFAWSFILNIECLYVLHEGEVYKVIPWYTQWILTNDAVVIG